MAITGIVGNCVEQFVYRVIEVLIADIGYLHLIVAIRSSLGLIFFEVETLNMVQRVFLAPQNLLLFPIRRVSKMIATVGLQRFGRHGCRLSSLRQAFGASNNSSASAGRTQPSLRALADQFALEFGQRCKQVEDQAALRAGGVDGIIQTEQTSLAFN